MRSCLLVAAVAACPTLAAAQVTWERKLLIDGPQWRSRAAIAHDEGRGVTVVFGGYGLGPFDDTWEWDGAAWAEKLPASKPPATVDHHMVYDAARGVCVWVGTTPSGMQTWEYDGSDWVNRTGSTAPPARGDFAIAYDRGRGRTILFGGSPYFFGYLNDTWEWDGTSWQRTAAGGPAPSPRSAMAMAFDPATQRIVLFGGVQVTGPYTPATVFNDTWVWDGTTWAEVVTPPGPPSAASVMTTHLGIGRAIAFSFFSGRENRAWEWRGSAWVGRNLPNTPSARSGVDITYDAGRDRVVLFGGRGIGVGSFRGSLQDVWEWDRTQWIPRTAIPVQPQARFSHGMTYDSARDRVLMFGGQNAGLYTDTWEWDGASWVQRATEGPPPSYDSIIVDHASRGEVVLYGGRSAGVFAPPLGGTWVWDGNTWQERDPPTSPPPLYGHAMAYDSARDRTVLFGGNLGFSTSNRTFEWDGSRWIERFPTNRPSPRYATAMAYDAARGVCVLFSGLSMAADTWEWDGTDWVQRQPANRPPADFEHRMVYDAARQRVVMFGHEGNAWEWDGNDWAVRTVTPAPFGRGAGGLAYDARRRCVVLFSGINTGVWEDLWEYHPIWPAGWSTFGAGCGGTAGVPVLDTAPGSLPWLGGDLVLEVTPVPAFAPGVLTLGPNDTWVGLTLPFPLTGAGMPGCDLLVGPAALLPLQPGSTLARARIAVPARASLLGAAVSTQAVIADPGANPTGAIVSNGGTLVPGGR